MRVFDFENKPLKLLTPDIVSKLTRIHEYKGRQERFMNSEENKLRALSKVAQVQSVGASNRIEGIQTINKRLEEIMYANATPHNQAEQAIVGYREVLSAIHEIYDYVYPRPSVILQLHKQLFAFLRDSTAGGCYRSLERNHFITNPAHSSAESARPVVSESLIAQTLDNLCIAFIESVKKEEHNPLLLIPMFILDFLCIQPFHDGNERMSRLLMQLLLYRSGYMVTQYISLEKMIEESQGAYYESIQASRKNWQENQNDYQPFVHYFLDVLQKAQYEFEERVGHLCSGKLSKSERVKAVLKSKEGLTTKKEIIEHCPDISKVTIERTLTALVKAGYLLKHGKGRATAYSKAD